MGWSEAKKEIIRRRSLLVGDRNRKLFANQRPPLAVTGVKIVEVLYSKRRRVGKVTVAGSVGGNYNPTYRDPAQSIAKAIRDSLDSMKAPSHGVSLKDMSSEKRAEMERLYGKIRKSSET
jgi:hypothetical protein